jgi:large subunit ribosomal protein L24e
MAKCTFCGIEIEPGTGIMYVSKLGKIDNFCSNKCEKNLLKLGRKPRKHRWTQEFRKNVGKLTEAAEKEEIRKEAEKEEKKAEKPKVALAKGAGKKLK